ncbi:hypothetical protein SAMN05421805_13310 [Saccharopolyspora antimicrobica]|uniref:Uncharacterized protein n=1 Tax=Saccharopolyspora antimicrobica TaxID=455193 RepID=A0A1I5LSP0_9PSEU|nr:hypothetical protein [Saccharopolyspora antimicrobica]RKT87332.1 hypothetical protein ATL45_5740 [Saccharopolyspora antimicrobica]SFP00338.1 hypothetical protein SAMN05421805_13310 [Saccharopolyspora antimicrobica]
MHETGDEENETSGKIQNELSGEITSAAQIGNNYGNIIQVTPPPSTDPAKQSSNNEQVEQKTSGRPFIPALIAMGLIWFLISQCGNGQDIPEESDPWPQGVHADVLFDAARESIQACSMAVVLAPVNCPQAHHDVSSAQNVRWVLRGDPMDGARIAYRDEIFYVYGRAVMTVSYRQQWGEPRFSVKIVPFLAKLSADGARLVELEGLDGEPPEPVAKRNHEVSDETVASAMRSAFAECAATPEPAMPPTCPDVGPVPAPSDTPVHWSFDGDPALNTRRAFDQDSGLIEVVGSYAATAQYSDPIFGASSTTHDGNYRASLVIESGALKVLQIEKCLTDCSD